MKLTINETEQGCIVLIDGRLDTINAKVFEEQIQPALEMANKEIILDCTKLAYISSSGLRQLLLIRKLSGAKGRNVIIQNLTDEIMQTLVITGFNELFEIR